MGKGNFQQKFREDIIASHLKGLEYKISPKKKHSKRPPASIIRNFKTYA